jgi:hypothetical protein
MTFGGYEVGRSVEAPIETVIFRLPFFLEVNFIAFVIKLTSTTKSAFAPYPRARDITLLHAVDVSNDEFNCPIVIRDIHGVMEVDILGPKLGLEDLESLGELPLRPHL